MACHPLGHAVSRMTPQRDSKKSHTMPLPTLTAIPVLLLAACEQKALSTDTPQGASTNANCNIEMKKPWIVDPQHIFTTEAMTMGPACQKAIVALAVRDPDNNPVLAWSARV